MASDTMDSLSSLELKSVSALVSLLSDAEVPVGEDARRWGRGRGEGKMASELERQPATRSHGRSMGWDLRDAPIAVVLLSCAPVRLRWMAVVDGGRRTSESTETRQRHT